MNARDPLGAAAKAEAGGAAIEQTLDAANDALQRHDAHRARELAKSGLVAARQQGDDFNESRCLLCIAQCDRVLQRTRRSSEASRRAARLFERLADAAGESSALNLFAHSCMLLGRTDEALEAALLSVQLSQSEGPTSGAVFAYNGLGMAYCWGGNHAKAATSLDIAIGLATVASRR